MKKLNKAPVIDQLLDGIVARERCENEQHLLLRNDDGYSLVTIRNIDAENNGEAIDKANEIIRHE